MSFFTKIGCCLLLLFASLHSRGQVAGFTATPTSNCVPLLVQFTNTSTGATNFVWNFGNGSPNITTTSVATTVSATYSVGGTYTVTLTASNGTTTNTYTQQFVFYDTSVVDFSGTPLTGCAPLGVQFTPTVLTGAAISSYSWVFGGGGNSSASNPFFVFPNQGNFNVSLQATNIGGCVSHRLKSNYVLVYAHPQASFTASTNVICSAGGSAIFTNTSTGGLSPYTLAWSFGDGGVGSTSPIPHTYLVFGNYNVKLVITDVNGCHDTAQQLVQVIDLTADFTAPASVCANEVFTASDLSLPAAQACDWNWGDGFTSTGTTATHAYSTAGTFSIRMIAHSGNCVDTVFKSIIVNPAPTVDFAASPFPPCEAPFTLHFTPIVTGAGSYAWNFGDGTSISPQSAPSHTYAANGYYDVSLSVTSPSGCVTTLVKPQYIKLYPFLLSITVDSTSICVPQAVHFSYLAQSQNFPLLNTVGYPYPITSWQWDFGDGATSTLQNPVHTYSVFGTYTVTLTATSVNGCVKTAIFILHAGTPPSGNFGAIPTSTCNHRQVQFTDSSLHATNWYWDFGDQLNSNIQNPVHIYNNPGVYTVVLDVDYNGCHEKVIRPNYIQVGYPGAAATIQYSCNPPNSVHFTNLTTHFNGIKWYFGDGDSSSVLSPTHAYPAAGGYNAMLVAWNDTTGCRDTAFLSINIVQMAISFTVSDTAVCKDMPITFSATTTGGIVQELDWHVGTNNLFYALSTVTLLMNTAGVIPATLSVRDEHNCIFTLTKNIIVSWPYVAFSASQSALCIGQPVTFTDLTPIIPGTSTSVRHWDFGDGVQINAPNTVITHQYAAVGIYNVKLVETTNLNCTDSVTQFSLVNIQKPLASFVANNVVACPNKLIQFTSTSQGQGLNCQWDFGDGGTGTGALATHAYSSNGTYTVTLIVTDNIGCKDTMVQTNYISIIAKPVASFTVSDTVKICPPLFANFTNTTTGATAYLWVFGNSNSSTLTNPSNVYQSGIYTPTLIAYNAAGCPDTFVGPTIHVLGYNGVVTYTPLTGCGPLTVHFTTHEHNVPTFIYNFKDGSPNYATSDTFATHTYTTPGAYVPQVTLTDGLGCSSVSLGLDTIKVDGIVSGFKSVPYPLCFNGSVTFTDTSHALYSNINTRLWIFQNGNTATTTVATQTYSSPGTYNVTLVHTTNLGCRDTLHSSITIFPLPIIQAGPDTMICASDSVHLQATGAVSYVWSPAAALSCTACTNPYGFPSTATIFKVIGTDANGCKNSDSVSITVKSKTTSSVGPGGEICEGDTLHLHVYGNALQHYIWLPSKGLDNNLSANPIARPDSSVNYVVIAIEGRCVPDTNYVQVIVHPRPHVNLGPDRTILAGETVQLNAQGNNVVTYAWTPEEGLSCNNCQDPEATPKHTITYMVRALAEHGCNDSDDITITVICKASQLYVPNSFTPNGDGQNDLFLPRGKGIRIIKLFRIYDRWGELIFEQKDIDVNDFSRGWDGTRNGKPLPSDVFVYMIDGICDIGEEFHWQGDITLIR